MHNHPTPVIKGTRGPQNLPNRQSEEVQKLSKRYLQVRNHAIDLKSKAAEIELAVRRGTLVEKKLIEAQATWLLIATRRKLMNLQSHGHRFLGLTDINQARQLLHEIGLSVLAEIRDLPKTATPGWLKELEADEGK